VGKGDLPGLESKKKKGKDVTQIEGKSEGGGGRQWEVGRLKRDV